MSKDINARKQAGSLSRNLDEESDPIVQPRALPGRALDQSDASDAERMICASLMWAAMFQPEVYRPSVVSDVVLPERFVDRRYGDTFEAIAALSSEGKIADPVSVHGTLIRLGKSRIETADLDELVHGAIVPDDAKLRQWATLVNEAWLRRGIMAKARAMERAAQTGKISDAVQQAEAASDAVTKHSEEGRTVSAAVAVDKAIREAVDPNSQIGPSSGFEAYDWMAGRFRPKHSTMTCASTGVGKTAWGLSIVGNVALSGEGSLYASTEMPADQLSLRLACSWAAVPAKAVLDKEITPYQTNALSQAIAKFRGLNLEFVRKRSMTVADLDASIRTTKRIYESRGVRLSLVVLDWIQQMLAAQVDIRKNRVQVLDEIAESLHELAVKHDTHVVALAQSWPPGGEKKHGSDGKPDLDNIAECKAMAKHFEIVTFIHREKANGQLPIRGPAEMLLRKSRWGQHGSVPLLYDGPLMRFSHDPTWQRPDR